MGVHAAAPARAGRAAAAHRRARDPALGAINVYLRDTQHFLELALLAWFWVTPIVYALHDRSADAAAAGSRTRLHAQPGHADRARSSSARSTPSSTTRTCQPGQPGHADPAALAAWARTSRTSATRSRSASSCSRSRSAVFGRTRGELRRGALAMAAAIEVRDVSKRFRLYHEHYSSLKERVDPLRADPVRGLLGARRHRLRRRGGHDRRHPRPQRLGQVDAAQVRRRHPAADDAARSSPAGGSPRCSSSAPASTPSSPGARTSS